MARPAIAATAAFGGGVYLSWRFSQWSKSLPHCAPGDLLTGADRSSSSSSGAVAVCAPLKAERLAHLGVKQPPGSNYARLDAPVAIAILDRLVAGYVDVVGTPQDAGAATLTNYGAETLIRATPPVWLAVTATEPEWVGDEQWVLLCAGHPEPATPPRWIEELLMPVYLRLMLQRCVQEVLRGGEPDRDGSSDGPALGAASYTPRHLATDGRRTER